MNSVRMEASLETPAPGSPQDAVFPPLHYLIERHAKLTPNACALTVGDTTLTYAQLNECANRLAAELQARGIQKAALVGICMHRCVEMIVSILAVLKAGGAYVPIDASYPAQRLQRMLAALPFAAVLVTSEVRSTLEQPNVPVLEVDELLQGESPVVAAKAWPEVTEQDKAYVVFTSGSTGVPKAAGVTHGGWSNLMQWFSSEFQIKPSDRVLIISSFGFDITQRSIVMPLIVGGHLVLDPSRHFDPEGIARTIEARKITIINCAPSMFYPLVERGARRFASLQCLRLVFLGGEAISASRIRAWAESLECHAKVVNVYGVAECSDVSTFHVLRDYSRYVASSVPLGTPVYRTQAYVLDEELRPVAEGETGEICLAGAGVGVGYVNDPELTARKFVADPFGAGPNALLYKTGDLGKRGPDGSIEFRGRKDYQVKVNGVRIELGDIEAALRQNPLVREAIATIRKYGEQDDRLVAFVTLQRGLRSAHLIPPVRWHLREHLPAHMVPGEIFAMEELPLTPNGKVDRKALQELSLDALRTKRVEEERPRTETEMKVAHIFATVLHLDDVGVDDNFFDLGGNSYLLTDALAEITQTISNRVTILDFLSRPTVASLAQIIDGATHSPAERTQ